MRRGGELYAHAENIGDTENFIYLFFLCASWPLCESLSLFFSHGNHRKHRKIFKCLYKNFSVLFRLFSANLPIIISKCAAGAEFRSFKLEIPHSIQKFTKMFLPTTKAELLTLGWQELDVILITGDAYLDSPHIGVAVIGKVLLKAGFRVGIIAQPELNSPDDITRLGEPALFWGITAGCIDSMIANYTATLKKRRHDDYTPGGINNRRPDRAVIVYSNLIRRYFKNTKPLVLGGIEASLRRIAHYDYCTDKIRKSILFDAKADVLVYGMAEKTVVELATRLKNQQDYRDLRGICYISALPPADFIELPSYEKVCQSPATFTAMFNQFYANLDPLTARGMFQKHLQRYLIHNPPPMTLSQSELDAIYELDYERAAHPYYARKGKIKALDTIQFALTSHRGCYGECNFCAISVHEGRTVQWRSKNSILREARRLTTHPDFKGIITDVGGPTANMYGYECRRKLRQGACSTKRCLFPNICSALPVNHTPQIKLLKSLKKINGIRQVFVASGIRHDLVLYDGKAGHNYLQAIVNHHISGQLKIAPEHSEPEILRLMGKPEPAALLEFKNLFDRINRVSGKKQFLTYYFIAAYPGCQMAHMHQLKRFLDRYLKITPEQVQIFIPAPSTYAAIMYYTERDPFSDKKLFVEKNLRAKTRQKQIIVTNKHKKMPEASIAD